MKARLAVSLRGANLRRGDKWVLRDIKWQLRPGARWALLGPNGAGKTQLLKLIGGDVWPTPTRNAMARSYRLAGAPVDLLDAKPRFAYIGAERQDKYARYGWNLTVRDVLATGLHRTDLLLQPINAREAKRIDAMLRACRLGALARRDFLSLSYGEKRLTLLARALVQDPDWLLLDEFYNGLDAEYRRRIDTLLAAARRRGQSWIASAHRAMDVPRGTRSVLTLAQGRAELARRLAPSDFAGLKSGAAESMRPRKAAAVRGGESILRLAGVDLYVEYRMVLRALDWQLRCGEHWSIFGLNGAGKSSFLKLLYGDLAPALGGKIERAGFPAGTPIAEWKHQVGYVSAELQSLYAVDVDILELVASGRYSSIGVSELTARDVQVARRWLKVFKLATPAKRRPRELSYGQLRRALIARAMAAQPRILLLDEPLTGLDPRQRAAMKRLLQRLMERGVTLVVAVHHAEDLPQGMTHGLHLHKRQAHLVDAYFAT